MLTLIVYSAHGGIMFMRGNVSDETKNGNYNLMLNMKLHLNSMIKYCIQCIQYWHFILVLFVRINEFINGQIFYLFLIW